MFCDKESIYRIVNAVFIDVFDTVFENCFDLIACALAVLLLDCGNHLIKPEKDFFLVAIAEQRRYEFEEKTFKSIVDNLFE